MYVSRVTSPASPTDTADLKRRLRFSQRLNLVLAAAVALLLVLLGGTWLPGQAAAPAPSPSVPATGAPTTSPSAEGETVRVVRRDPSDPLAIGRVDAPVVLVEWADLRCPYCSLFTNQTLPALVEQYVDTGKVRIEFNDVSLFGEQSTLAAVALRAAAEQDRFAEYLAAVHAAAPESGHPDLPREKLVDLARTAGVPDLARFEQDLDRDDLRQAVDDSTARAQELGINSVPFFVVNSQAIPGAQPLEVFQQVLDAALEQAGA